MEHLETDKLAIWAITPNGLALAEKLLAHLPGAQLFASSKLETGRPCKRFQRLSAAVAEFFPTYPGHLFITATGIAVRMIAPHLSDKTSDPAVVVLDDGGQHAISLVSGHTGGANALTHRIAGLTGARPVITTATDVSGVLSIDMVALENGLAIENPGAIKHVNMALLRKENVALHDPHHILKEVVAEDLLSRVDLHQGKWAGPAGRPGIFIDDAVVDLPDEVLVLRPRRLAAGIGCNRNTTKDEMEMLLKAILSKQGLSINSLKTIASIDIKKDEPGLLALAEGLNLPLVFFNKDELNTATGIENPSAMAKTYTGAQSVCEAAAILATDQGNLIVPKQKSKNATVAIARAVSI